MVSSFFLKLTSVILVTMISHQSLKRVYDENKYYKYDSETDQFGKKLTKN